MKTEKESKEKVPEKEKNVIKKGKNTLKRKAGYKKERKKKDKKGARGGRVINVCR